MTTTAPGDIIAKFNTPTDQSTLHTLSTGSLALGETGISFNLQIIEKGLSAVAIVPLTVSTSVIGTGEDQFNPATSQELANVIAQYLSDKSILTAASNGAGGSGRNIRSMKLIVNVDPTA